MKKVLYSSLLITVIVALGYYFYVALPDVSVLKRRNPQTTALMTLRTEEYKEAGTPRLLRQIWVPYDAISEHLKKAVLVSEDAAFFSHNGVDFDELKAALEKDWQTLSFSRGGSTITMQLARNLYLSPSKNPLRKLKELLIAHRLEQSLSKQRIFELYLNVVEWGRNVYGAEAAARYYFGKVAADLDPAEGATLAALLPNPRHPRERNLIRRRNVILNRLSSIGYLSPEEYQGARRTPVFNQGEEKASCLSGGH